MAHERVDISVLVVDNDDTSLAIVANVLNSLGYKVLSTNSALNALEILREFRGFIDLLITELHISGMNGFEFQKCVENQFHIPVLIMSADGRSTVISKSFANGAAQYILKPFSADDFKDIWRYAKKLSIQNNEGGSVPGDNTSIQDVNSATSSNMNKRKRKYCPRMSSQMNKEGQSEESSRLVKKPKVVWTTYLHNRFLLAIKQIGLEKAVPKTIVRVMNVPNLTRENVASHLQKYRIFLKKVADKGLLEGLSNRDLRSRFASGLSASMINDIQAKREKSRVPAQQFIKRIEHQSGYGGIANVVKPYNNVSSVTNTPLGRLHQFPHPCHKGLNLNTMLHNQRHGSSSNQARLGAQYSSFGSNARANNIQQNMLGSYANQPYYAQSSYNNAGVVFPSDGVMGHGLMNFTNGLRGGMNHGANQFMYPNYGSFGNNHNLSNGQGVFASTSNAGEGCSRELPKENIQGNLTLPQQQLQGNVAENDIGTSIGENNFNQLNEDDFSDLFMMLDEMDLNETGENHNANDFLKSDFSISNHAVESLEKMGGDDEHANMEPLDRFVMNDVSSGNNSATDEDWDFELIEALFGEEKNQGE
ncbi:two-component response regulator ARR2-like [Glycine soja]|uniref:two-component response regulator ARR2 n=1 Tax=Glycine max TaxID=3847 RepID=UPI0003DEC064|nr:two-component response regulator ARR2 [Glycine max]XP_028181491.1 two-component response regulator ARR2-like [Glycine soja]|eukprot:XP_006588247.1 two-component response regulator ARR2 [Glycine max]